MLTEPKPLSDQAQALLKELVRPGVKIDAIIPADATAEKLWDTLTICAQGYHLLQSRMDRLKPIIGKILLIFKDKPDLYTELGYRNFEEFRNKGVGEKLGLHRTTLWETQVIANDWPQLVAEPDRYTKIGRAKLNILSKYANGRDANAEALLKMASSMSTTEFRQYSEQRGLITPGQCLPATIVINCDVDTFRHWKHLVGDGRVHSVVGSAREDIILEAMIDNCRHEWIEEFDNEERNKQDEIKARLNARTNVAESGAN